MVSPSTVLRTGLSNHERNQDATLSSFDRPATGKVMGFWTNGTGPAAHQQATKQCRPPGFRSALEHALKRRPDILQNTRLRPGIGVQAIVLHQRGIQRHAVQQERDQWHVEIARQIPLHSAQAVAILRSPSFATSAG